MLHEICRILTNGRNNILQNWCNFKVFLLFLWKVYYNVLLISPMKLPYHRLINRFFHSKLCILWEVRACPQLSQSNKKTITHFSLWRPRSPRKPLETTSTASEDTTSELFTLGAIWPIIVLHAAVICQTRNWLSFD